ncbi:hypothetical protein MRS44_016386 [Fusarium solani]|uniref:Uncharacterized protein n=1 Tax=Fusarium solani TaxID=169388 RepID=A0A9P9HD00_FUSSL|nr:uncharacterized protein B0J15DRAFT_495017 [Fusarium solani]KAH7254961.1 hypothetical protein B0J15DRAFT_495017 [Fusarium solani]KAJ3456363.1 hypothetical protein MRS44_016386 [Fusarium solani]
MRRVISNGSLLGQWMLEIGSITLASGAVAAMVILLINFDGERVFDGPMVTLNAIISTLSTTSRVCLLAMLASSISQWNWLLFSTKPRRLVDFEYFSAASRGPLGSLKVLLDFRILGGFVVRAGALVTVLTVALDPFAQQLVQLRETIRIETSHIDQASIAKADNYSLGKISWMRPFSNTDEYDLKEVGDSSKTYDTLGSVLSVQADLGMEIAIKLSYVDGDAGLRQQVAYTCSSADCEFEPFDSLAVCSRCDDITVNLKDRVVQRNQSQIAELVQLQSYPDKMKHTEYYLPNGLYLSNPNDGQDISDQNRVYMAMFGTGNPNRTVAMTKVDTLIWAQSFIKVDANLRDAVSLGSGRIYGADGADDTDDAGDGGHAQKDGGDLRGDDDPGINKWPGPKVSAQECALYYCVKQYTAVVRNGTLKEDSTTLKSHKRIKGSWQIETKQSSYTKDLQLPEYGKDYLAWDPVIGAFSRSPLELGSPESPKRWSITQAAVYSISVLMKRTFTSCMEGRDKCQPEKDWGPPNGYAVDYSGARFEPPIAETLWTSHDPESFFAKLAHGISIAIRNGADGKGNAPGKTLFPVTVYNIAWPWIALHCSVTLGALVFLIITIWSTSKAKLPAWKSSELAVFSQGSAVDGVFSGGETYSELEEKAKTVPVVLLENRGGGEDGALEEQAVQGGQGVPGEDISLIAKTVSSTTSLKSERQSRGRYETVNSSE